MQQVVNLALVLRPVYPDLSSRSRNKKMLLALTASGGKRSFHPFFPRMRKFSVVRVRVSEWEERGGDFSHFSFKEKQARRSEVSLPQTITKSGEDV